MPHQNQNQYKPQHGTACLLAYPLNSFLAFVHIFSFYIIFGNQFYSTLFYRPREFTQDKKTHWMIHMPMHNLCRDEVKTRNIKTLLKDENIVINHYMGRYVEQRGTIN